MKQRMKRFYLDNGNNENEIVAFFKQQRSKNLRVKGAWVQDDRYLFLSFEECENNAGNLPREIVKQGKKKKYRDKGVFRQAFQNEFWQCLAEVETEDLFFIFLRHRA